MNEALGAFLAAWPLFQDPMVAATLAGLALGSAGPFVAMMRLGFLAAAMGQCAALGLAASASLEALGLVAAWPRMAAALGTMGAALAAGWARPASRDGLLLWLFVAAGALSLVLGSHLPQDRHDLQALLMGTAVVVLPEDLWALSFAGGLLAFLCCFGHRLLSVAVLDPEGLRSRGGQPLWVLGAFLVAFALCMAAVTKALGALPALAMAALPGWGALRLGRSLPSAMSLSAAASAAAGFFGYLLAFFAALPVGPSQAVLAAAFGLGLRTVGKLIAR